MGRPARRTASDPKIRSYSPPFPSLTVVGRERGAGTSSTQIVDRVKRESTVKPTIEAFKGKAQHRAFRFSFLRVRTPELAILSLTPFQLICYPLTPSDLATIWFRHEQTLSLTVGRLVATIGTGMRADNPLNACVRLRRTTSPPALRDIYTAPSLLWPSGSMVQNRHRRLGASTLRALRHWTLHGTATGRL